MKNIIKHITCDKCAIYASIVDLAHTLGIQFSIVYISKNWEVHQQM